MSDWFTESWNNGRNRVPPFCNPSIIHLKWSWINTIYVTMVLHEHKFSNQGMVHFSNVENRTVERYDKMEWSNTIHQRIEPKQKDGYIGLSYYFSKLWALRFPHRSLDKGNDSTKHRTKTKSRTLRMTLTERTAMAVSTNIGFFPKQKMKRSVSTQVCYKLSSHSRVAATVARTVL